MEKNQKKTLLVGIGVIALFIVVLFVAQYFEKQHLDSFSNNQDGSQVKVVAISTGERIAEENKDDIKFDKEVSFCGKIYKTNGAMLGNIDIVQKVAEIATKNNSQHICENITGGDLKRETLLTKLIQSSPNQADYNPSVYYLQIGDSNFKIDVTSKKIYVLSGFDGEPAYIGVY
jgi:hypothetical protein